MNSKTLSVFIIFFSVLFVFQTLEITAVRSNPKTCCGHVICLCKHGANKLCDFKNKPVQKTAAELVHVMPCHRKAAPVQKVEIPEGAVSFTAAPCAKDTPKTVMPQYFKDYLFSPKAAVRPSPDESAVISFLPGLSQSLFTLSIEHPPRTF